MLFNRCLYVLLIIWFIDRLELRKLGKNTVRDHYLSTTFLEILIFVYALNKQYNETEPERVCGALSRIGKAYSADIYRLHLIIISVS